jgi:hypothetical protein
MNFTIQTRNNEILRVELIPAGPEEQRQLRKLVDAMLLTGSLKLDAGEVAFQVGPFGEGHADGIDEVGPSPLLPAFRAIHQADQEIKP